MRFPAWPELETLQERIDRAFGRSAAGGIEEATEWLPAVDLQEADDELVLTAEFPGMTEKDIEIEVEQNVLTLRGEKKSEKEEKGNGGRWYLLERSYGAFQRSFTLPGEEVHAPPPRHPPAAGTPRACLGRPPTGASRPSDLDSPS